MQYNYSQILAFRMTKQRPLTFDEDTNYKEWKSLIGVWSEVTNEPEENHASLIILSIKNNRAQAVLGKLHYCGQ